MKLYLIRHGEDLEGCRGGWTSNSLTLNGRKQIEESAKILANKQIDKLIASDLKRTQESAEIISTLLNKKINYDPSWREYNNGLLANMKNEDADRLYPHYIFNEIDMDEHFPLGESPKEYYLRINDALKSVIKENVNTLIVTHGGVIDVVKHILDGKTWTNSSKDKKYYANAEIVEFDI